MSNAKSILVADEVVAKLNDAATGMVFQFQAERAVRVMTLAELQELKDVRVRVFTGSKKLVPADRSGWDGTYKPVISVQRKFDGVTTEQNQQIESQLELLCDQIIAVFTAKGVKIQNMPLMAVNEGQDYEMYSAQAAAEANMFTTAIVLTYQEGE
jgi:hypothetical protein